MYDVRCIAIGGTAKFGGLPFRDYFKQLEQVEGESVDLIGKHNYDLVDRDDLVSFRWDSSSKRYRLV